VHHTFDDIPSSRWLNSVSRFLVGSKVSVPLGVICICGSNCVYVIWVLADSHRQRTVNWIDGCGGLSCAFDFTTKAILQEAVRKREWWRLRDAQGRPPGVLGMWPSRAVTFIDNHDTGSTQVYNTQHITLSQL
jgi:hypothetical protein